VADQSLFNSLSVIIPTYNREHVLAKALEGYLAQSSPSLIHELLVMDDGSTDGTESLVSEFRKRAAFPIRYLRQSNKGPGAARNFGIREARSPLVLFTDSDVIPKNDLVEQHIKWHQSNPQITTAVLGYLTWDPAVDATPFMRWYGEEKLFMFGSLRNEQIADFHAFYTCNLSIKTEFLRTRGQFDEEFTSAAYEDTELGYRLSRHGLQLLYNSAAIAYHHQFFSFEDACRKARSNSAATQLFFRKEAGQQILREIQRKQSNARYALATALAPVVAGALFPIRYLLDSRLPLPRIIYRLFFWMHTRETTRQSMLTVRTQ
jgi:glycosyltransferase involved in cell wall biosynthesis